MSIDLSYISQRRLEHIRQAESADAAASMGLLDSLMDKIFRGGAKESAIRSLYAALQNPPDDDGPSGIAQQMQNFQNLRNLMLPEHRETLTLEVVEHPDESWDYAMRLDGQLLQERKGIQDDAAIAELKHTRQAMAVDDYLCKLQNYDPTAASLVHRSDSFLIEQGKTGDCYALATMIGIMSNPAMQKKIESMAEITEDNKLRLKFDVRPTAFNIRDVHLHDPSGTLELARENLATICADEDEVAFMREKGYDLSLENGVLQVDISEDKLRQIIGETRSANTNSLIVNILEHFSGNLLLRLDKVAEERAFAQLEDTEADSGFTLIDHARGMRSNRESILAHHDRAGNYDPLIANLLGYVGGAFSTRPDNVHELSKQLQAFDRSELCLESGGANGFVYIGMKYGKADAQGQIHNQHALLLHSIEYNVPPHGEKKRPVGAHLQNPWGNRQKPEYFPLDELNRRNVRFVQYLPA